jgi:hypothetical protein
VTPNPAPGRLRSMGPFDFPRQQFRLVPGSNNPMTGRVSGGSRSSVLKNSPKPEIGSKPTWPQGNSFSG